MKYFILFIVASIGGGLIFDGGRRSEVQKELRVLNLLELKGSPYGEIVGAALQEPVSIIHHGGIGHEHVGDGEECATCGVNHGGGNVNDQSKLTQLKSKMRKLEVDIRQNNLPGSRSAQVLVYEKEKVKELMTLAYEMDPTNFGNYSAYSHFSGEEGGYKVLYEIAQNTLRACEGRLNDPGDALTAAAAAESILVYRSIELKKQGLDNPYFESDYELFRQKVTEFEVSYDTAIADGRLAHFSQKKVDEMLAVYKRFDWAINAYRPK